jgi:hypothetical protein
VQASENLRAAANQTGQAYVQFLDHLAPNLGAFQSALAHSESLEHFHLFHHDEGFTPGTAPTLHMHTDLGLFIVMTPPRYFNFDTSAPSKDLDTGFHLKLPNGEVVTPVFPSGCLLVMNGEGMANWVHSPVAESLYIPPHEVILPDFAGHGRAWYGRMFLPSQTAQKVDDKTMTFKQYWTERSAAVIRAPGSLIALKNEPRRLLVDQGNCSAGQVFCWMSCQSTANVSTCNTNNIVCTDPNGKQWPQDFLNSTTGQATHCFACTVKCNASTTSGARATLPSLSGLYLLFLSLAVAFM